MEASKEKVVQNIQDSGFSASVVAYDHLGAFGKSDGNISVSEQAIDVETLDQ